MGATRRNIIELNGKHYDALTGKMVQPTTAAKQPAKQVFSAAPKHLDGFSKRPSSHQRATATPAAASIHKKTEKSKTLMRKVVAKPTETPKLHAKAPATSSSAHAPKTQQPRIENTKPGRVLRANSIAQSSLISKFGKQVASLRAEAVPVKEAPKASPVAAQKPVAHEAKPVAPVIDKKAERVSAPKEDPFRSAIAQSLSHEQPRLKKVKLNRRVAHKLRVSPRLVNFAAITLVAIATGGFLAYQNLPELSMRLAATRAGFSANLPSYQPSGFQMAGPIAYQPGEVTLTYKSNSDARSFNVTQKNSSWNSETLLENFVTSSNKPYQTFQANGRTIYIYDNNKATWVDGGVWYNIDGQSGLNSDQLLRIANSL